MNLYIDVDGVILTKNQQTAKHLNKFLSFVIPRFDIYWLTTHCKGNTTFVLDYLSRLLEADNLNLIKKIKPTNWNTFKTEAIDFTKSFFLIDDYLFEAEKNELKKHNKYSSWILVNLQENPDQLDGILPLLKTASAIG